MVPSCGGEMAQAKQNQARRVQVVPLDFGIERARRVNCLYLPTTPAASVLGSTSGVPPANSESPSIAVQRCKNPLPPGHDDSELYRRQLVHLTGICARCEANVCMTQKLRRNEYTVIRHCQ